MQIIRDENRRASNLKSNNENNYFNRITYEFGSVFTVLKTSSILSSELVCKNWGAKKMALCTLCSDFIYFNFLLFLLLFYFYFGKILRTQFVFFS